MWKWAGCPLKGWYRNRTQLPLLVVTVRIACPVQMVEAEGVTAGKAMSNISWRVHCAQTWRQIDASMYERVAVTFTPGPGSTYPNMKAESRTRTVL